MEVLLAIALGYLLHKPVMVCVDPTYKPDEKARKEHTEAARKVASGVYPRRTHTAGRVGGAVAAGTAVRTAALWQGVREGAKERWSKRKQVPRPKEPVPATFQPAPVVAPPLPPMPPPLPQPPGSTTPPKVKAASGPDEPPRLIVVPDLPEHQPQPAPSPGENTPTPPPVASSADPEDGPRVPAEPKAPPVQNGEPAVTAAADAEVTFGELVHFLDETVARTRDDQQIASFVAADDKLIADRLDQLASQAANLAEGDKVLTAINDLREKCSGQAVKAREYASRCSTTADKAATAKTNVDHRYGAMAAAARDMEGGPAMSSYYED
ncbi:hypothetical protein C9F11_08885 [Streptomyces sp. YIM 121038]|uniref:hypothetical protein n=1 Tax=Streptomyces sp. YIM 121038 TaxID=2136401 RepID=UPI0011106B15|nr:hypothetical protein [Streptomyces sp. YIM 121038]QCX75466.1 hypothetical protein C9F11_08885 [Streptomyces sp. YIM 121038]